MNFTVYKPLGRRDTSIVLSMTWALICFPIVSKINYRIGINIDIWAVVFQTHYIGISEIAVKIDLFESVVGGI